MHKKKLMIVIVFALVILLSMFSGCVEVSPVITDYAADYPQFEKVALAGRWHNYSSIKSPKFAVDNESHENWQDYKYKFDARLFETYFRYEIHYDDLPYGDYYFRAVAWCYDFRAFMKNYKEGWYQGEEDTFYLGWKS